MAKIRDVAGIVATVRRWAERWRSLKAWGRPLTEVEIAVVSYGRAGAGYARPVERRCIIFAGRDLANELATALHELAHLAAPADAHHGRPWRERFAAAVLEVTGVYVPADTCERTLDLAAEDAMRLWLEN